MPWVKQQSCTGCGVCIDDCPAGAIELTPDGVAEIDESECIRCGRCHDVCPQEAVRHDGERIPQEVAGNLQWVGGLLGHFPAPEERSAFLQRIARFFNKQKKVSEQTIASINAIRGEPAEGLVAAIGQLLKDQRNSASKE